MKPSGGFEPAWNLASAGTSSSNGLRLRLHSVGASGCVVLGAPDYYGRFGFKVVDGLLYPGVPDEYFQGLSFSGEFPQGEVAYHEALSAQG